MSEGLQPQIQMNAIQDMMVRLEYVWLDGYTTKNLRSKVRYENWRLDTNEGSHADIIGIDQFCLSVRSGLTMDPAHSKQTAITVMCF